MQIMYKFKLNLRKSSVVSLIFFNLLLISAFSEEAVLNFGGKLGWNNLVYSRNIEQRNGKFGFQSLGLTSASHNITETTDMYLSFDFKDTIEETGNYTVANSSIIHLGAEKAKIGEGAALFHYNSNNESLTLKPSKTSFFAGAKILKSFTIEFWLCPQTTESGSTILRWWTSLVEGRKTMYQNIAASIFNNKLEWSFLNIWQDKNNKGLDVRLSGKSNIIPEIWSHHLITYDETTGLLEYRMNGKSEAIVYMTETGRESNQVLYSALGTSSDVLIGLNYSGLIDELKVTNFFSQFGMPWEISSLFEKYPQDGGRIETNIIDTGGNKSQPRVLKALYDKPEQTDAEFFIRAADRPFNWNGTYPEWKSIRPNEDIKNISGRFFQIACNIYPDAEGLKSPLIHSFSLEYEKDNLPLPPSKLIARAGDSSVELFWSPSIDTDVKGYLIYFGNKKGEYFVEGSPIDVGNVISYKIENLKNGKIYFFAIAAYDEENGEHAGDTSKEVWARPLQSKKEGKNVE